MDFSRLLFGVHIQSFKDNKHIRLNLYFCVQMHDYIQWPIAHVHFHQIPGELICLLSSCDKDKQYKTFPNDIKIRTKAQINEPSGTLEKLNIRRNRTLLSF